MWGEAPAGRNTAPSHVRARAFARPRLHQVHRIPPHASDEDWMEYKAQPYEQEKEGAPKQRESTANAAPDARGGSGHCKGHATKKRPNG